MAKASLTVKRRRPMGSRTSRSDVDTTPDVEVRESTRSLLACFVGVGLILATPACTALVQRSVEPERVVREESPRWIVIGTTAGDELVLRTPRLQGDSLVVGSLVESVGDSPRPPDLVGVPLGEIAWVATAEPDRVAEAKVAANAIAIAGLIVVPWIAYVAVGGS